MNPRKHLCNVKVGSSPVTLMVAGLYIYIEIEICYPTYLIKLGCKSHIYLADMLTGKMVYAYSTDFVRTLSPQFLSGKSTGTQRLKLCSRLCV